MPSTERVRRARASSTARACHSSSSWANSCPIAWVPSSVGRFQRRAPSGSERTGAGPGLRTAAKKSLRRRPAARSPGGGRTVDRARCPGRCPQRARPHPHWRSVRPEGTHRPRSPTVSAAHGQRRTARRQPPPAQGPGPHTRARPDGGGPGWGSGHRLAVRPGRPPPAPGPPSAPPARLPRPRAAATGRLDPLPRFASVARARCALAFPGCPRPRWAVVETACSRREEPAPPAASTHAGPRSEP